MSISIDASPMGWSMEETRPSRTEAEGPAARTDSPVEVAANWRQLRLDVQEEH